jgi:hypothetical protein
MKLRILHGESSIAANWTPRNLFPTTGNSFAGYQFSSLSERRRDGPFGGRGVRSCPTPRFSQMGLETLSSTTVTAYYDSPVATSPDWPLHGAAPIAWRKVDSIATF